MWTVNAGLASALGPEGSIIGTPKEVHARAAESAIRAGLLIQRGTAEDQVAPLAALPAADPDLIMVGPFAPAVTDQLIDDIEGTPGGVLDGAAGGIGGERRVTPPRSMSATFDAHANWGLAALGFTRCAFIGLLNGRRIVEPFYCPAGGAVTVHSDQVFDTPIAIRIGQCDGAGGGSGTWGWSVQNIVLPRGEYALAAYELAKEPSATATVSFDAGQMVSAVVDGIVMCVLEVTAALACVAGDPVAVRVVAAGLNVRGQITRATSPLNLSFALLEGAHFLETKSAGDLVPVRIGG